MLFMVDFFNHTDFYIFQWLNLLTVFLKKIMAFAFVSCVGKIYAKLPKYSPVFSSCIIAVSIILNSNPSGSSLL